jgi:PPOX class probable F420-dependent enzyme
MSEIIPDTHKDLLAGPVNVVLTTVMPDGQPQTTPVWCNLDGDFVLINTMQGFRKEKNMRTNPMVTLLAYKLKHPLRNIEVRGLVVEMTQEGALDHLDDLNKLYTGKPHFFGDSLDAELRHKFTPIKVRIKPFRVRVEG